MTGGKWDLAKAAADAESDLGPYSQLSSERVVELGMTALQTADTRELIEQRRENLAFMYRVMQILPPLTDVGSHGGVGSKTGPANESEAYAMLAGTVWMSPRDWRAPGQDPSDFQAYYVVGTAYNTRPRNAQVLITHAYNTRFAVPMSIYFDQRALTTTTEEAERIAIIQLAKPYLPIPGPELVDQNSSRLRVNAFTPGAVRVKPFSRLDRMLPRLHTLSNILRVYDQTSIRPEAAGLTDEEMLRFRVFEHLARLVQLFDIMPAYCGLLQEQAANNSAADIDGAS